LLFDQAYQRNHGPCPFDQAKSLLEHRFGFIY
jgi:hypothetical protein